MEDNLLSREPSEALGKKSVTGNGIGDPDGLPEQAASHDEEKIRITNDQVNSGAEVVESPPAHTLNAVPVPDKPVSIHGEAREGTNQHVGISDNSRGGVLPLVKLVRHGPIKYRLKDGTPVPGASTVSNIAKDMNFIMDWVWAQGKIKKPWRKARDWAADVGTVAHFMITCSLEKQEPDLSDFPKDVIDKAKGCFDKFAETWEKEGLTLIENELSLVSEQHRFGGTLDIVAQDKEGRIVLIDEKTSKGIYDSHILQIVAYEHLWTEDELTPRTPISRRVIFRHGKGGAKDSEIRWLDNEDLDWYWNRFLKRVALYEADKRP